MDLLDPCVQHGSAAYAAPFMGLPDACVHLLDPCVQHGSAAYAVPFMGLPDACVHGSS